MAKSNVVSLSVHKNTRKRRKRKELRADMVRSAKVMASTNDLVGWVLVGFDRNANAYAAWDTGQSLPVWAIPGMVDKALTIDAANYFHDQADDYKPEG